MENYLDANSFPIENNEVCSKCQQLKIHKINLNAEIDKLRQRLIDAGLDTPAVMIDYSKHA
jgi:hypothetical protein